MAGDYSRQRPSKQTTFAIMMVTSAVLLLLPWDILGAAKSLSQLAAVPQAVVSGASQSLTEPLRSLGTPALSAEKHAELVARQEALENENTSLTLHLAELQARIDELTRIRREGFPAHGKLIPAKIIGADAVASRGSLLLSKGSLSQVKVGDWVTSRRFVDAGTEDGVRKGASVLARESLIGWVEETEALTSRVVLLSDNVSRRVTKVHIGRHDATSGSRLVAMLDGKPASFALQGAGGGLMKIPEIGSRWVDQKLIRVGDVVISSPDDARLPVAMVIGEIIAMEKVRDDKKKPLYYNALVKHRYDPRLLGQVFIADFSRQEGQRHTSER